MKQKFMILTALALLMIGFLNTQTGYAADKDCADFSSQKEAQIYFLNGGGSETYNFNGLDRDHDAVACEDHKGYSSAEIYYETTLPESQNAPEDTNNGGVMPDTASHHPYSIVFGLVIIAISAIFFIRTKPAR